MDRDEVEAARILPTCQPPRPRRTSGPEVRLVDDSGLGAREQVADIEVVPGHDDFVARHPELWLILKGRGPMRNGVDPPGTARIRRVRAREVDPTLARGGESQHCREPALDGAVIEHPRVRDAGARRP